MVANASRMTAVSHAGLCGFPVIQNDCGPLIARLEAGRLKGYGTLAVAASVAWCGGGGWLGRRDSNPDNLLQRQVSYR